MVWAGFSCCCCRASRPAFGEGEGRASVKEARRRMVVVKSEKCMLRSCNSGFLCSYVWVIAIKCAQKWPTNVEKSEGRPRLQTYKEWPATKKKSEYFVKEKAQIHQEQLKTENRTR